MSAIFDYNDHSNFAPQGYYPPYAYSSRPYPSRHQQSAVPAYYSHPTAHSSGVAAAPAGFSYSHHQALPAATSATAAAAPAVNAVPVLAERYKTKYCKNFVQYQHCPYEERCMFAHGEEELRTVEDNVRDGLVTEEAIKTFQRQYRHAMLYQQQQQQQHEEQQQYGAYGEEEDVVSTATVPKAVYLHSNGFSQRSMIRSNNNNNNYHHQTAAAEMPQLEEGMYVKEFVAENVYRFNPYGTLGGVTNVKPTSSSSLGSRCSSVDNMSSVAGDDEEGYFWAEESTPQKRPLMTL